MFSNITVYFYNTFIYEYNTFDAKHKLTYPLITVTESNVIISLVMVFSTETCRSFNKKGIIHTNKIMLKVIISNSISDTWKTQAWMGG